MIDNADRTLAFSVKDQADLTLALIKTGESGLLRGASEFDQTVVKTIFSELGTNIIKYARRGVISVKRIESAGAVDIAIEASDMGPGIADIELAMQDRYSTGTSLGLGLPSVRRMADVFSIVSAPGEGTQVSVQKRIQGPSQSDRAIDRRSAALSARPTVTPPVQLLRSPLFEIACHFRPAPGEMVSGDMAALFELRDGVLMALVDVSGHGAKANELASDIRQFLTRNAGPDIHQLMSDLHGKLRGTQGAAVALLYVDSVHATAHFCSVGNTGAYRVAGPTWRPISKDGVLGQRLPTLPDQSTTLQNGDVILMWTDGISELAGRSYAAKNAYQPADTLARELVTQLGRPFDDASCIIFKWIA